MSKYLIALFLITISVVGFAQVEDKKFENNKIITVPAQKKDTLIKVDSTKKKQIEQKTNKQDIKSEKTDKESKAEGDNFNVFKELSGASRDTLHKTIGELQLVKISEELKIDCVWVKAAEYYSVWDSKNINPYQKNASIFKDTIDFHLYNYDLGELWASPLENCLQTSAFGYRWGSFHHGIDLNLQMGTPIYSVFDGIIRISAFLSGYGNCVVVRHKNGLETLYGHMSTRKVEVGQVVKAGQLIGLGGSTGWSTGPHLHFEVRYEGNTFNPTLMYDFTKKDVLISEFFRLLPLHFAHYGNKIRQKITHTVLPGETLSTISAKYNVPIYTIAKMNQITINAVLQVGQTIIIR